MVFVSAARPSASLCPVHAAQIQDTKHEVVTKQLETLLPGHVACGFVVENEGDRRKLSSMSFNLYVQVQGAAPSSPLFP
jgi:hypothetical protein